MERIGTYSIERKLGEGGMGTVYLARSRGGRSVAVKVARPELAADSSFRERFRAEVAAARMVGGFHTAPVVDADPDAEAPWLATAYIAGPTLSQLLAAQGPMDEPRLRRLGAALAEALQAIHGCGLVHRDLKPGNIIMADDGPRVLDFGIARAVENTRLTATGMAFGTPGFLAPEQAEGRDVTAAADVFALGAVLVAAAGGSAFGGGTPVALMYRSVHQEADLSAVPPALLPTVAACLDKDPARRPDTERLLGWLTAEEAAPGPSAHPPTVPAPVPTPTQVSVPAPPAYAPTVTASAPPAAAAAASGAIDAGAHGPEFLAMDRKNAVVADADGISFGVNGRASAFAWSEIRSARCTLDARRKALVVTVSLTDGSHHDCRVTSRVLDELHGWVRDFYAVVLPYGVVLPRFASPS